VNESASCDGVLMVGFGGPTRADEVRPFLDNVLRGRPVPPARYEQVVHHYEMLSGRSPYTELTLRQADALRATLARLEIAVPVAVGMRNWSPYLDAAVAELARVGVRRVFGFIMAAHRSAASWQAYQRAVADALAKLGARAPEVEYNEPWHTHPRLIAATAARVREAYQRIGSPERGRARLVFTAHSIPVAMAQESGYVEQVMETSRLVAADLGVRDWTLAFQSRSGSPREPWLEPDIGPAIRALGRGAVAVVTPIGFLCDHVEVLYDLDIEAQQIAREAGVRMERAPTVSDHPEFIAMLAEIVSRHVRRG
jgi:protoporphyrin/coproporphyrin ferrochelatase